LIATGRARRTGREYRRHCRLILPGSHRQFSGKSIGPSAASARTLAPPAAFQIGSANLRPLQQFAAGSGHRNQAVDHDVAAMGEFQRMVGVLLDDQDGEAVLPVQCADGIEDQEKDATDR